MKKNVPYGPARGVQTVLRCFSYLFHLILGFFLLAVGLLALGSDPAAMHLGMLPWAGQTLSLIVLFGALLGLAAVALAYRGKVRPLFFVWSLGLAVLLLKSYVFSSYRFSPGEIKTAGILLAASWLALAGAWSVVRQPVKYRN
jgi:hypothetical protein